MTVIRRTRRKNARLSLYKGVCGLAAVPEHELRGIGLYTRCTASAVRALDTELIHLQCHFALMPTSFIPPKDSDRLERSSFLHKQSTDAYKTRKTSTNVTNCQTLQLMTVAEPCHACTPCSTQLRLITHRWISTEELKNLE